MVNESIIYLRQEKNPPENITKSFNGVFSTSLGDGIETLWSKWVNERWKWTWHLGSDALTLTES